MHITFETVLMLCLSKLQLAKVGAFLRHDVVVLTLNVYLWSFEVKIRKRRKFIRIIMCVCKVTFLSNLAMFRSFLCVATIP